MTMKLQLGTALALGLLAQAATAGDITGTIKLNGTAPAELPITLDPACGKLHAAGSKHTTQHYLVGAAGGLANVVVYLKGQAGKSTGASASPLVLDQANCFYSPQIAAVQTGQKIAARNSDAMMHNVHPTPKPGTANKETNKAQMPKSPDLDFVFPAEEMHLRFKCDIHPWMFAWVSVFDHPFFAVTDKDGKFTIKGVPAGKYTLVANHRKANGGADLTKDVEVTDSGAMVELALEAK